MKMKDLTYPFNLICYISGLGENRFLCQDAGRNTIAVIPQKSLNEILETGEWHEVGGPVFP